LGSDAVGFGVRRVARGGGGVADRRRGHRRGAEGAKKTKIWRSDWVGLNQIGAGRGRFNRRELRKRREESHNNS